MQLDKKDFERIKDHVLRVYGINLEKKEALVASRLTQLAIPLGYKDFHEYTEAVFKNADLMQKMVTRLTTNYTFFMREEKHYRFMQETAVPQLLADSPKPRVLKIWSAGCSSGDEAYTTAIILQEFLTRTGSNCSFMLQATDISHDMLAFANQGIYTDMALKGLNPELKMKYFESIAPGQERISPVLAQKVHFSELNLMNPFPSAFQNFHIIFCRNVMIYFTKETRIALIRRFYDALLPGGYLFIGTSETMPGDGLGFKYISPAIYQKER